MRISLNWLKDYIDLKPDTDVSLISRALTMAGLEVESIENLKDKVKGAELAVIKEKIDDPERNCYRVMVDGKAQKACASQSELKADTLVGYIEDSKAHKGCNGRLLTLSDLELPGTSNEVVVLGSKGAQELPHNLSSMPEFDDVIITLGITPNRADALSHLGVSRELSALMDLSLRAPSLSFREMAGLTHERALIEIENDNDCPRYALRVIENIKIEPSPLWLKLRLWSCGIRPINNVVDVTNYVMLSRGQPMHAYDYDKLAKDNRRTKIIVRKASNESLKTIDGKELKLKPEDIVIADMNGPIALAGVMGGAYSAVSEQSSTILLESAYFDPALVRMSARRHGISSESSYRFERGADPNAVVDALNYAARLLVEISDAKACREPIDAYRKRIDPLEIKLRLTRAQEILGIDALHFDEDLLRRKFLRLGIETVAKSDDAIYFRVPTFRPDCTREIDLIEEAARMIGYDKINEEMAYGFKEGHLFANGQAEITVKKLRDRLVARGFSEAINYAFLPKEYQEHFLKDAEKAMVINVLNPLSDRYNVMRSSLVPGLLKNLLHNQRNQEKSIKLFEIGTVFLGKRASQGPKPELLSGSLDQDSFAHEKQYIAGVIGGLCPYNAFDFPEKAMDFYHLKGAVSECLEGIGLSDNVLDTTISFRHGSEVPYLHPGESATIFLKNYDKPVGQMGKLHPHIAEIFDAVGDIFIFELVIEPLALSIADNTRFKNFSRFPGIMRDVALLVDEEVAISDILAQAPNVAQARELLSALNVFDIYRGKNIPAGKKSVAISMMLQRPDRTLTDEEAECFVTGFLQLVAQKTGAQVR